MKTDIKKTRSPVAHPIHPDRLERSRWSSVSDDHPHVHYEVVCFRKKRGELELMAVLDRSSRAVVPWRELRDRERWEPGWRVPCSGGEEE